MKKVFIPAVIILMAALYFGCSKKKTNVEFDILYTTDVAVPTMSATGQTYTFTTPDILTDISNKLTSNNTNANLVGEIRITNFDVSIKTPSTSSVSFIKSMKVLINALNFPEQQVAFKYNEKNNNSTVNDSIYPGQKTTTFRLNDPNLKNRYMENSVYFRIKLEPVYPTTPTTITITHNVHVKAITE